MAYQTILIMNFIQLPAFVIYQLLKNVRLNKLKKNIVAFTSSFSHICSFCCSWVCLYTETSLIKLCHNIANDNALIKFI